MNAYGIEKTLVQLELTATVLALGKQAQADGVKLFCPERNVCIEARQREYIEA